MSNVNAGSVYSEAYIKLDKLEQSAKLGAAIVERMGQTFDNSTEQSANAMAANYSDAVVKIEKYISNLSSAVQRGALTEQQALKQSIDLRRKQLELINNAAILKGGYSDAEIGDLKHIQTELQQLEAQYNKTGTSGKNSGAIVQAAWLGAATVITLGIKQAIQTFTEYEQAQADVQAATRASAEELEALSDLARKAGPALGFSATQATKGIEALAKAGVSTSQILGGALDGALSLAAAGTLDVGAAAETAAALMVQFGKSGSDVGHIADLLAAAAGKAQGEVSDFSIALKQSGLVASQTGLSIEETVGALAAFASNGLLGSDAGTSFRTMLLALNGQSKEAKDAMAELGISAFDAQGKFVGLEKVAGQLQKAFKNKTDQERQSALQTIFGSDAIRAASVLYQQGAEGIAEWTENVDDAGFAAETARIKMDTLNGDLNKFGSAAETAASAALSNLSPALRGLVQVGTAVLNFFSSLPAGAQAAIAAFTLIGGGMLALAGIARGLGLALSAALGPIGLVVAAVTAVGAGIAAAVSEAEKFRDARVESLYKGIAKETGLAGEELEAFNDKLGKADTLLTGRGGVLVSARAFEEFAKSVGITNDQLAQLVLSSDKAKESTKQLALGFIDPIAQANRLARQQQENYAALDARGKQLLALEDQRRQAEQNRIAATLSSQQRVQKQVDVINNLYRQGAITLEDAEKQAIKIRQDEVDALQKAAIARGSANATQVREITEQIAAIDRLKKAQKDRADAEKKAIDEVKEAEENRQKVFDDASDKLLADADAVIARYNEQRAIIDGLTADRIENLEKEKAALLSAANTDEERLAVEKLFDEKINAIRQETVNKEVERQAALRLLIADEGERKTADAEAELQKQVTALESAGATEIQIEEFVASERLKIAKEAGKAREDLEKDISERVKKGIIDAFNSVLSAISDGFRRQASEDLEELERQAEIANEIANEKLEADLERLDAETEAKLKAAGVSIETEQERLEKELALAKEAGDSAVILEKENALKQFKILDEADKKKKKIDDEAAAAEKERTKKLEHDKAQIQYEAAHAQWIIQLAQAGGAIALGIANALSLIWPANLVAAASTGIAGAIQIGALIASEPKPPKFATGGIVMPKNTSGTTIQVAENGSPELLFNAGASGAPFVEAFAGAVAAALLPQILETSPGIGPISFVLNAEGRALAEIAAQYYNKGIVRLDLK
jgi:TP901 family phage tail tape measure protein